MRRALSLAVLALLGAAPVGKPADLLIRHVTIVDVAGARLLRDQAVAVRGDTIVATGRDAVVARNWRSTRTVEGEGRYLIPGLWDMHVHFGGGPALVEENKALLPLYVAHGITTVRDCAGDLPYEVLAWRDAIAKGTLFGPRLYTSGPKIEGLKPIWKGTLETASRADVDAAVAKLRSLTVDFVKITDSTLDPKLFLYAVGAARRAGLRVSGHIPAAVTIGEAVAAGISSIEHLDYAMRPGAPDEAAIAAAVAAGTLTPAEAARRIDASFNPQVAARTWKEMVARGVVVTPTLTISRTVAYLDQEDHRGDRYLALIGPGLRKTYDWRVERAARATPAEIAWRHAHVEALAGMLPTLHRAGVTIMAGTDAGFLNSFDYPGKGLHDEMALYVRYGLTPAQALASATRAGPAWFGRLDRYGAVAAGKAADLVLLDADPLRDIAATRQIATVVLRGRVYDREALGAMLESVREKVAVWDAAAEPSAVTGQRRLPPPVPPIVDHFPGPWGIPIKQRTDRPVEGYEQTLDRAREMTRILPGIAISACVERAVPGPLDARDRRLLVRFRGLLADYGVKDMRMEPQRCPVPQPPRGVDVVMLSAVSR